MGETADRRDRDGHGDQFLRLRHNRVGKPRDRGDKVRAIVLGSAAGGGFPQWNDNTAASRRARQGDPAARPRSQASLAVSANERDWFVLNASPDLRQQIEATPALQPRQRLAVVADCRRRADRRGRRCDRRFAASARASPLRDIAPTPGARDPLGKPDFRRVGAGLRDPHPMPLDWPLPLVGHAGNSGLSIEAYAVPGKLPLYQEGADFDPTPREDGDVIGLAITETATGKAFHFIPGCAAMTDRCGSAWRAATCIL